LPEQENKKTKGMAPIVPIVPDATGIKPQPNHVERISAILFLAADIRRL